MKDIPQKSPGDQFFSDECNSIVDELENTVKDTGQTLSASDDFQVSKSIANYVGSGDYFNDGGSATAYVLSPLALKKAPTLYVEGLRVRFAANNTNTASATVNVASLGVKPIVDSNGQALNGGEIIVGKIYELVYDGTNFILNSATTFFNFQPLFNQKSGLEISNNTIDPNKDIDIAPGTFSDSTGRLAFSLYSTLVKQIDANWVAGTNQGGFPSGLTLTADRWYHKYAIATVDGVVDGGYDSSINATNLLSDATGYIYFKRIASVYVDSSLNILAFFQFGNTFLWDTPVIDSASITASFTDVTLSVPPDVNIDARVRITTVAGAGTIAVSIKTKAQTGEYIIYDIGPGTVGVSIFDVMVGTDSKIEHKYAGTAPASHNIKALGWTENI